MIDYRKLAIEKVKKIIKFRKKNELNGKRIVPSPYSKNKVERSLGNKLTALKTSKNHGNRKHKVKFYPELLDIVKENNEENLFEYIDKKQIAIDNLNKVFGFIKNENRFPRSTKKNPLEFKMNKFLCNFKNIKQGKLQGIWYPELDKISEENGYSDLFKVELEQLMVQVDVNDLIRFYKKHSKNPSQLSKNKNERDLYRKLIRLKQIKAGKTIQKWNPDIDLEIKNAKIKKIFG